MELSIYFTPTSIQCGKDLYFRYAIEQMTVCEKLITAKVSDYDDNDIQYDVEIVFDNHIRSKIKAFSCECDAAENGRHCEHQAAVLIAYDYAVSDMKRSPDAACAENIPDEIDKITYMKRVDGAVAHAAALWSIMIVIGMERTIFIISALISTSSASRISLPLRSAFCLFSARFFLWNAFLYSSITLLAYCGFAIKLSAPHLPSAPALYLHSVRKAHYSSSCGSAVP